MKLLLIQNTVHEKINDSLADVENLIKQRQSENFDFLVLPEMFTTPYQIESFADYAQTDTSLVTTFLKDLAIKHQAYVVGGSVPERDHNNLYNTTYVFNRQGKLILKYRKIHLYAVTYPNGISFNEADVLKRGKKIGVFETEFGTMGVMICFDIRYPLLAHKLMKKGTKVIFTPGVFNDYTGPLHWAMTFRVRATDNQLFMVGASVSSNSYGSYKAYGHSLVVNPLGHIVKSLERHPGIIEYVFDLDDIKKTRESLPILKNEITI